MTKTKRRNANLHAAARAADDEFYTPRWFIEEEVGGYDFGNAPILCPCDGEQSEFVKYFKEQGREVIYGAGDYFYLLDKYRDRTDAVVVTNPPFTLFRLFVDRLIGADRYALFGGSWRFLIVGAQIALGYQNVFKYARAGLMTMGYNYSRSVNYNRPDGSTKAVGSTWYTNLTKIKPEPPFRPAAYMTLTELKQTDRWAVYDERPDVIWIKSKGDYPVDYFGPVAVPVTSGEIFNDRRFELLEGSHFCNNYIGGAEQFGRIVVRRRPETGALI